MIKKKRKGQAIMVGIMIAVMALIVAIILIEPLKIVIGIGRDIDHLDCANTSIGVGQQMSCIILDWYTPYFFGVCIFAGISWIFLKKSNEIGQ